MRTFFIILNNIISAIRSRINIFLIKRKNQAKKNIVTYQPCQVEDIIESDSYPGSYIFSGQDRLNRTRALVGLADLASFNKIPTVILHQGDGLLQAYIGGSQRISKKLIIQPGSGSYDPFFNRTNQEIASLIKNSSMDKITSLGQAYIEALADFIRSKNIPPYYDMFARCPHGRIFEVIEESEDLGYISSLQGQDIKNLLIQGQGEKNLVKSFFDQVSYQGGGILASKSSRARISNIKSLVANQGLIMIDIGSSTNDLLINLITNEIKEALNMGTSLVLIIDEINTRANDQLFDLINSSPARCLTTISSEDIYSSLGSDERLFYSLVSRASKCLVFSHTSGVSAEKWAQVFGYYDQEKISKNMGNHGGYFDYGFNSLYSYSISENRDYVVKEEEIRNLKNNTCYLIDKKSKEIGFFNLV